MFEKPPTNTPENHEVVDDNARKFIVTNIDHTLLADREATSFTLTVDWLEVGTDSERKVAYKDFDDGTVQILLISKVTQGGNRTSKKEKISDEEYQKLLNSSIRHLEKRRHEFEYTQSDITFDIKLDEFTGSELTILEVDASNEDERSAFDHTTFPAQLTEVTGDITYYGYRIADIV